MLQRRMSEVLVASPLDSPVVGPRLLRSSSALFQPRDTLDSPKFPDAVTVEFNDGDSFSSSLRAVKAFNVGDMIADLTLHSWEAPVKRYTTVQYGKDRHIELGSEMVFCNHSCNPNVHFDMKHMHVVALRQIQAGDELCFFYPSSEWCMDQPFQCWCGAKQCIGWVAGAKFLAPSLISKFVMNDYILDLKTEQLAMMDNDVGQDL